MVKQGSLADLDPVALRSALAGDAAAMERLVDALTPIVQARVARALLRRPESRGRDIRNDVADLSQEVFVALFSDDSKALKAWDPALGLSLANFVGLLAQRRTASILRVKRRTPWSGELAEEDCDTYASNTDATRHADTHAGSRQLLQLMFEHLQTSLSPRGLDLFYRLYVDEQSIEDVCQQTGLNASSVYQWKSRLGKAARVALEEVQRDLTERDSTPGSTSPRG